MSKQPESSVLASLKELKGIEDDRKKTEQAEAERKVQDEARAKAEAEQHAREAEEAKLRESEAAKQAAAEAQRKEEADARLRLAEAERRARIEAESKVELERLRLEAEQQAQQPSRTRGVVIGVVCALVVVLGGLGYLFGVYLPDRQRAEDKRTAEREASLRAQAEQDRKALLDRLDRKEKELQSAIQNAKSDEDRAKAQKALADLQAQKEAEAKGMETKPTGMRGTTRTPPRPTGMPADPMPVRDPMEIRNPLDFN
jgi:colicin import membrane protein